MQRAWWYASYTAACLIVQKPMGYSRLAAARVRGSVGCAMHFDSLCGQQLVTSAGCAADCLGVSALKLSLQVPLGFAGCVSSHT